jgi:abortive infection bacteriophage resistance protein
LPNLETEEHNKLLKKLSINREKSTEAFVAEYRELHEEEAFLPIWMAVETLSIGSLAIMYQGLEGQSRKEIADRYCVTKTILISWLESLVYVRNLCAHHSRLWNRKLAVSPIAPKRDGAWEKPKPIPNNSFYAVSLVLERLHRILGNTN